MVLRIKLLPGSEDEEGRHSVPDWERSNFACHKRPLALPPFHVAPALALRLSPFVPATHPTSDSDVDDVDADACPTSQLNSYE